MILGELKSEWWSRQKNIAYNAGSNRYEIFLIGENETMLDSQLVPIPALKAIIDDAKINQSWLVKQLLEWLQ